MERAAPQWVFGIVAVTGGCGGTTVGKATVSDGPPSNTNGDAAASVVDGGATLVDGGATAVGANNGSRLSIEGLPFQSQRVRDETKGVWCSPRPASDGAMRCLPESTTEVVFIDAACTHPVVATSGASCESPQYFADSGGPAGCVTPKVSLFTAGAPTAAPPEYYRHSAGACSLIDPASTSPNPSAFYEAVPANPGDWVDFTEVVIPVTESLGVTVWKGSDGSRLPGDLRLLPSRAACDAHNYLASSNDPPTHCVPTLVAHLGLEFADDRCSGPKLGAACAATELVDSNGDLHDTGQAVSPVYVSNPFNGGNCTLFPPPTPSDYSFFYEVGPRAKLERYPELRLVWSGSGRVQSEYLASEGKGLVVRSYRDTKYGQECQPMRLSDGGIWCVPSVAPNLIEGSGSVFSDAACMVPIRAASGTPGSAFGLSYPQELSCSQQVVPTLYSVTLHAGPVYVILPNPGGFRDCVLASSIVDPSQRSDIFDFVAPVDPATVLASVPAQP